MDRGREIFLARVEPTLRQCVMYEDPAAQEAARKTVPREELEEKALVALAKEGKSYSEKDEIDYAILRELLLWFKGSFRWVNSPSCGRCTTETVLIGAAAPNPEERRFLASKVEIFRCPACYTEARFPRYNDPVKLLETRSGRCGEWANCFTLYCRALGYRARLILEFSDHIWTECYSPLLGRWVHTDPCEGVMDRPLLYEEGWKKKLSYVIALAHDGVHDVTKRYTRKWPEVLTRRVITSEESVQEVLDMMRMQIRADFSPQVWNELAAFDQQEEAEIAASYQEGSKTEMPLPGRQSGSEEWRSLRGEMGSSQESTPGKQECPVRTCVDEHVKVIREAVGSLLSDMVEADNSTYNIVQGLQRLHGFLMKVKAQPFRTREAQLDSQTEAPWLHHASDETIAILLQALGLQWTLREDGLFWVSLAEDPVQTALRLPVALELLDSLTKDQPSETTIKWLVHGSRLSKGVAVASDEEPPLGISCAAFDGLSSTKWEEPNGAKGAWIVYHLPQNKSEILAAYELTSANDCPARDPRDWILEGSSDNGKSWRTLDSQSNQKFSRRFANHTYEITQENRCQCNSFRLRVTATLNPNEDSRLQIASINLITQKL